MTDPASPRPHASQPPTDALTGEALRPHAYDGITEFDKKLPNWWLHTLYWTMVFSFVYWFLHFHSPLVRSDGDKIVTELTRLEAVRLASAPATDDASLWQMAANPEFVSAGRDVYSINCQSCHAPDLRGKDAGGAYIGANLADATWTYGDRPELISKTIGAGILAKGMPAWEQALGPRRMAEVTAYLLSHHKPDANGVPTPNTP